MRCGYVPNYLLCTPLIFNSGQTGIFGKTEMLCISRKCSCFFWGAFFLLNTLSNFICNLTSSFRKVFQAPRQQGSGVLPCFYFLEVTCSLLCKEGKIFLRYFGTLCTHSLGAGGARAHALRNPPCALTNFKKKQPMPVTSEKSAT